MSNKYLKLFSVSVLLGLGLNTNAQSLLKDINTGANGCQQGEVVKVGNTVFFRANDQAPTSPDFELWKTDATASGTVKISINSGISGFPKNGASIDNDTKFVFAGTDASAGTEMFIYNVSSGSLGSVIDIYSGGANSSDPDGFTTIPNSTDFVFAADIASGRKLHKSTTSGSVTALSTSAVSNPANFCASGSWVYFAGDDGSNGTELWRTNGTTTSLVKDINPSGSSFPDNLIDVNGTLFFTADDGVDGVEIWKSDGSASGTVMVKNINTTSGTGSNPSQLTAVGNTLFFVADDGATGNELWYTDGTASGTNVENIYPNATSSNPTDLVNVGSLLFFAATRPAEGNELFYFDPSSNSLHLAANVDGAATNSSPQYITNAYGDIYFSATTTANGRELWKWTNGSGATAVGDINSGSGDSAPKDMRVIGSDLVFFADNGTSGAELWEVTLSNAPTISPVSTKTINENQTSTFTVNIGSAISSTANLTLTGSSTDTTLIGVNGYSFSGSGSTRTVNITPKDYENGNTTVTLMVCDNSNNCVSTSFSFVVNDVNNAPVLSTVTKSEDEDVTMTFLVDDFTNKFTDYDGTTLDSVSIASLPTNGTFKNNNTTITSSDLPLKVQASVASNLKFEPNTNWNGSTKFRWNANSGGLWADSTAIANLTVNAVNDVPYTTKWTKSINEDTETAFTSTEFDGSTDTLIYRDVENSALASIKITYLPPQGVFKFNGDTVTAADMPKTILTANIGNLTYTPDANFVGNDFCLYQAGDGAGFSIADSLIFAVQSTNDLPTVSNFAVTFNEDQIYTFARAAFDSTYSDVETPTLNKIQITSLPLNGTLKRRGVSLNSNDTIIRKDLDSLTFTPDLNFNGSTSFQFRVSDGTGYSASTGIATLNISAINDAPVVDKVSKSGNEDNDITFTSTNFSNVYSDVENDPFNGIQITSLPSNGTLMLGSATIVTSDLPFDITSGSISNLVFSPNDNWNGMTYFMWKGDDNDKVSTVADTVEITLAPINDNPKVYNFPQTTNEDTELDFFSKDITDNFTDVDGDTLVHLLFTDLPNHGTLSVSGIDQNTSFTVLKSLFDSISYMPATNYNGKDTAYYIGFDGALYSTDTGRIVFTISPVNDGPVNAGFAKPVDEDLVLDFLASEFSSSPAFTDLEGDAMTDVKIISLPANGTLRLNNTPIQMNNVLTPNQIGNMTFTPDDNYYGETYFTYQANDGDLYSNTDSVVIMVNAVNDKPVLTVPGTQLVDEDVNHNITGVSVADIDVTDSSLSVSISANQAVLSLASNFGLNFTQGDGSSDADMAFEGNLTNVNNALSTITYDPNTNFNGFDQVEILISDLGNNGSGGAKGDTALIPIQIDGVNDTTIIGVNTAKTVFEAQQLNLDSITLTDIDGDNGNVTVNLSTSHGFITLSGTALLTFMSGDGTSDTSMTFFGSLAAINPALSNLKYVSHTGYYGPDALNIAVTDTGNSSVATDNAQISIQVLPRDVSFTGSPLNQARCEGGNVSFSVAVDGTPPFNYQWKKDGVDIPNATASSISLTALDTSDAAVYTCMVTNPASNPMTSTGATLALYDKPDVNFGWTEACTATPVQFTDSTIVTGGDTVQTYIWDMGDGTSFGIENPLHTFSSSNPFNVELIAITNRGCSDTITQSVSVIPKPVTLFSVAEACDGDTTEFTNATTTSFGNLTYSWSFGDGDSSMLASPSHLYATVGSYTATLNAYNNGKCRASMTKTVTINPNPVAGFSYNNVCQADDANFTNTTTISSGISSYIWDFGDNSVSNNVSPTKGFAQADTFDVKLVATSAKGCSDSLTQAIIIYPLPNVVYAAGDECSVDTVHFSNASSVAFGGSAYAWDFGDGNTTPLQSPSHFYSAPGIYNTKLVVTGVFGCQDSASQQVEVYPNPTANWYADNVCDGFNVDFVNTSALSQGINSFKWNFGNGTTSTNTQPTRLFNSPGNYDVKLVVTSDKLCKDSLEKTVRIHPVPSLNVSVASVCEYDTTEFVNSSSIAFGGVTAYYNFGNGVLDTATNLNTISYHYPTSGIYTLNYKVVADSGCADSTSQTFSVFPVASLNVTATDVACAGGGSGSLVINPLGGTPNFLYSIDSGATYQSTSSFTGLTSGTYNVVTKDANGCNSSYAANPAVITEPAPIVFGVDSLVEVSCFGFNDGFVHVAPSGGTAPYLFSIDTVNFQTSPDFPNLNSGNYQIILQDANGCQSLFDTTVTQPSSPINFTFNFANVLCKGDSSGMITMTGMGSVGGYEYSIDGMNYFANNVFNQVKAGNYTMYVRDSNLCETSKAINITEPAQSVALTVSSVTDVLCYGDLTGDITVNGAGGTGAIMYALSTNMAFGNNTVFSQLASGNYMVYAQDFNGCLDSSAVVIAQPASPLSIDSIGVTDVQCFNTPTGVISIIANGGSPQYMYAINAGSPQSGNSFNVSTAGTYLVFVTDSNSCVAVDTAQVNAPTAVVAGSSNIINESCEDRGDGSLTITGMGGTGAYTYSIDGNTYVASATFSNLTNGIYTIYTRDANNCVDDDMVTVGSDTLLPVAAFNHFVTGNTVSFNNLSTDNNDNWWNFGDGNTSMDVSPIHSYGNGAIYSVTLAALNNCGEDTLVKTIDVNSTGIDQLAQEGVLKVYPNPATNGFRLNTELSPFGKNVQIKIYNQLGQLVIQQYLLNTSMYIATDQLSSGSYLIVVEGEDKRIEDKLVIGL